MKLAAIAGTTMIFLAAAAQGAAADTAIGLVGDNTLVQFDAKARKVTRTMAVEGFGRLLGIDVRPSDKKLYGVASDGTVVTIDTKTGKATKVSKLEMVVPAGGPAIVDFNPAADKLRFMGADGTNLRADVDTGKVTKDGSLAFEPDDGQAGKKPRVVAAAYTNSFGKPKATAMYDIDAALAALVRQTKPNDGTLKTIGKLGIDGAQAFAFDVHTTADGTNTAWLVADNRLFTVSLDTGAAKLLGEISGAREMIRDVAVLPAP